MRRTNMKRLGILVAALSLFVVACGDGEVGSGQERSSETVGEATTTTQVEATTTLATTTLVERPTTTSNPTVVAYDQTVFESGWHIEDEALLAFAGAVDLSPEEALVVLNFQGASSQVLGDPADVFGDRYIHSAFTLGKSELTLFVTEIVAGDQEWVDQLNLQPTGGRFFLVADPELRAREEAECPHFASRMTQPPELDIAIELSNDSVVSGEQFGGTVTVTNSTEDLITFGGYPSFLGVLVADDGHAVLSWPLADEPGEYREWEIEPGQAIQIGFTGGTEPCGWEAPEYLPPGTYSVSVAWAWGLVGWAQLEVVVP